MIVVEVKQRNLESLVRGNVHARFGGGRLETCPKRQCADRLPYARARLPQSPSEATQELLFLCRRGKVEAWKHRLEPPVLEPGEHSERIMDEAQ